MRTLLLPFTPRYIALTIAAAGTATLAALIYRDPDLSRYLAAPLAVFVFFVLLGLRDLPYCRAYSLSSGSHPPGDAAIFFRKRQRRRPLSAR